MRVAIIHPWFPQYRKEFFEQVVIAGAALDIKIDIYHGVTPPELAKRGDSVSSPAARQLSTKYLKVNGRHVGYKSLKLVRAQPKYDLVILEQAIRNIETYESILFPIANYKAFWGHGKTYTKQVGKAQEWLKTQLTLRSDWFFAYTEQGAQHVISSGFPDKSVTVVNNTIDTSSLAESVKNVTTGEVAKFKGELQLQGPVGLFVGGLDASKRLGFLLEACKEVRRTIPDFSLVVAGDGTARNQIEEAALRNDFIRSVGPIFGHRKAVAMSAADVMLMPGRVGLVAVDSFASGVPIITTDWPWHAPEFEYLAHRRNALISENSLRAYSDSIKYALSDANAYESLNQGCLSSADMYNTASMVARFISGLDEFRNQKL